MNERMNEMGELQRRLKMNSWKSEQKKISAKQKNLTRNNASISIHTEVERILLMKEKKIANNKRKGKKNRKTNIFCTLKMGSIQ